MVFRSQMGQHPHPIAVEPRDIDRVQLELAHILTHNLGYVLLHSPFAGKTGMDVRGGIERVKR